METEHRQTWYEGGRERCPLCLQTVQYERTVRCGACDGALCEHCIVVIFTTGETLCPDCSGTSTGREEP